MKEQLFKIFIAFVCIMNCSCAEIDKPAIEQKLVLSDFSLRVVSHESIFTTAPFSSCHASTVLETEHGIIAAWFGGTVEGNSDVCIYSSIFSNSVWSEPVVVADGIITDTERYPCWNPVLYRMSNGKIVLFYKVGPSPQEWWGAYKISSDEGMSWGMKTLLPDGCLGPIKNKAFTLPNGKVLYPSSVEYASNTWRVFMESSELDLTGWKKIY